MNEPERERWTPPEVIGLCPDYYHAMDFYVPHGGKCPEEHLTADGEVDDPRDLVEYVQRSELTALRERVEGLAGELEAEGFHFAKVNANPNPFQPDPSYGQGLIAASFRLRSLLSGDEVKPERERFLLSVERERKRHSDDIEERAAQYAEDEGRRDGRDLGDAEDIGPREVYAGDEAKPERCEGCGGIIEVDLSTKPPTLTAKPCPDCTPKGEGDG